MENKKRKIVNIIELILGASSFITILVLYKPLEKVFDRVYI